MTDRVNDILYNRIMTARQPYYNNNITGQGQGRSQDQGQGQGRIINWNIENQGKQTIIIL